MPHRTLDRRLVLLSPLSLLVPRPARAQTATVGSIRIDHPWAKPSATEAAALFVSFENVGAKADQLIGGAAPVANEVILREADGSALDTIELLPRRPMILRPGWRYIALRGLKAPLEIDETFPMTFIFAHAGNVTMTATVEEGEED
jgi:copper(I)-binding protein